MSAWSSNTSVTCDRPKREMDRISTSPCNPCISVSMGKVICFSISSAASAAMEVLICTWTFVMSGTASMGSRDADQTPAATTPMTPSSTKMRWRSEKSNMRATMGGTLFLSVLFWHRAARCPTFNGAQFHEPQALYPLRRDQIPGVQPVFDFHQPATRFPTLHTGASEMASIDRINIAAVRRREQSGLRDDKYRLGVPVRERHRYKLSRRIPLLRIVELDQSLDFTEYVL